MDISYLSRHYRMIKLFVFDTRMFSSLHLEWKGWPSEIRNILCSQQWTRSAVQMSFTIRLQAYILTQNCWLMKRFVCCLTC